MSRINDLIAAYTLGEVAGLDTSYGGDGPRRNINLKDPNVYTTVEVEPALPPEGAKVVNIGRDLNKSQELVGENVGENKFLDLLKGLLDYKSSGLFNPVQAILPGSDYDKKGDFFGENPLSGYGQKWDQEKENKLAEQKRKADLGGDAIASPEQTRKTLLSQAIRDDYSINRLKELNDYELERFKDAYPQYAKMINDEIFNRRMQIEYNSPREITERVNASRRGYVDALAKRAAAQSLIADATSKGLTFKAG
jgi:hypothetical protein